ncbi:MAG: hypothetical protein ACI9MR_003885 [Myxococcota bacterium]|jgi:hypothetical protein
MLTLGTKRLGWLAGCALVATGALAASTLTACDYEPTVAVGELPPEVEIIPEAEAISASSFATPGEIIAGPAPVVVPPIGVPGGEGLPVVVIAPPEVPALPTRPRRRMDIDQLSGAIRSATGFGWTGVTGGREFDQFEALANTLGRPDYIESTQEDFEPTALFQKFLGEAARTTCTELAEAEVNDGTHTPILLAEAGIGDTYESAPNRIDANLRQLLLRFHGTKLEANAPGLDRWRWLFRSALHVSGDTMTTWRTVCTGLVMHPDFYTY